MLQCIKLELLLGRSQLNRNEIMRLMWNIYFDCRRDFRRAKIDPATGSVVLNPVKWLEMPGIEIV